MHLRRVANQNAVSADIETDSLAIRAGDIDDGRIVRHQQRLDTSRAKIGMIRQNGGGGLTLGVDPQNRRVGCGDGQAIRIGDKIGD